MALTESRKALVEAFPSNNANFTSRKLLIKAGIITLDNSYQGSGGETLDLSAEFPGGLLFVLFESKGGYVFNYDKANGKVIAYYGDNNNAADGPLIEVPGTTDLSTTPGTVGYIAIGLG